MFKIIIIKKNQCEKGFIVVTNFSIRFGFKTNTNKESSSKSLKKFALSKWKQKSVESFQGENLINTMVCIWIL